MISIINEDNIVVYDEIGWGDTIFHDHNTIKKFIENDFESVIQIQFYSAENKICLRTNPSNANPDNALPTSLWFRNITPDFLNYLCLASKFCNCGASIRRFFIRSGHAAFSVTKYPLLAATILGNNNQY